MIATILWVNVWLTNCTLLLIQAIQNPTYFKFFFKTTGLVTMLIFGILGILLCYGYEEPQHSFTKEEIIKLIEIEPSVGIEQAIEWNQEESRYNNYFFRFTLREENLIDIYSFENTEEKK